MLIAFITVHGCVNHYMEVMEDYTSHFNIFDFLDCTYFQASRTCQQHKKIGIRSIVQMVLCMHNEKKLNWLGV
jgi:hypothetical protein